MQSIPEPTSKGLKVYRKITEHLQKVDVFVVMSVHKKSMTSFAQGILQTHFTASP